VQSQAAGKILTKATHGPSPKKGSGERVRAYLDCHGNNQFCH
jgi:hypothetical protein